MPISASRFVIDDEIICPLCHTDSLGDELHYITQCSFFETDRNAVEEDLSLELNRENIFDILKSQDTHVLNKLAQLLNLIMCVFDKRNIWDRDLDNSSIFSEDEE